MGKGPHLSPLDVQVQYVESLARLADRHRGLPPARPYSIIVALCLVRGLGPDARQPPSHAASGLEQGHMGRGRPR